MASLPRSFAAARSGAAASQLPHRMLLGASSNAALAPAFLGAHSKGLASLSGFSMAQITPSAMAMAKGARSMSSSADSTLSELLQREIEYEAENYETPDVSVDGCLPLKKHAADMRAGWIEKINRTRAPLLPRTSFCCVRSKYLGQDAT